LGILPELHACVNSRLLNLFGEPWLRQDRSEAAENILFRHRSFPVGQWKAKDTTQQGHAQVDMCVPLTATSKSIAATRRSSRRLTRRATRAITCAISSLEGGPTG
jgi:hypothetical protein